jgi:hypothetical protein
MTTRIRGLPALVGGSKNMKLFRLCLASFVSLLLFVACGEHHDDVAGVFSQELKSGQSTTGSGEEGEGDGEPPVLEPGAGGSGGSANEGGSEQAGGAGGGGTESEIPDPKPCACINTGFQALGPPGTKGKIDGPAQTGNGTYQVLANSCHEVKLKIKTGYIKVTISLSQNAVEPCEITLAVTGSIQGKPVKYSSTVKIVEVVTTFDSWTALKPSDIAFWNGTSGNSMTIEIDGHNHTFSH